MRFDRDGVMRMPKIIPIHAGYPLVGKAAWLSHLYTNCYFELSIMTPLVHRGLVRRYLQVMEAVPLSKILFSSDAYHLPELYWLTGRWGKRYLGQALAAHVRTGTLTHEEAVAAARRILVREQPAGLQPRRLRVRDARLGTPTWKWSRLGPYRRPLVSSAPIRAADLRFTVEGRPQGMWNASCKRSPGKATEGRAKARTGRTFRACGPDRPPKVSSVPIDLDSIHRVVRRHEPSEIARKSTARRAPEGERP